MCVYIFYVKYAVLLIKEDGKHEVLHYHYEIEINQKYLVPIHHDWKVDILQLKFMKAYALLRDNRILISCL